MKYTKIGTKIWIQHHGETCVIEWRPKSEEWNPSWWRVGTVGTGSYPFGHEDMSTSEAVENICETHLGEPVSEDLLDKYFCSKCRAIGVKLWHEYGYHDELLCWSCCENRTGRSLDGVAIGWWHPAIPQTEEFFYPISIPIIPHKWWMALPFFTDTL